VDDALHLMQALKIRRPEAKVLGFIAGVFDRHVDLHSYQNRQDLWYLDTAEINAAILRHEFHDASTYRSWLFRTANGRTVIRPDQYPVSPDHALPVNQWEQDLVDFNVQAYREILKNDEPKVEASGSLHMSGGPAIGVVIDSPAMRDIVRD